MKTYNTKKLESHARIRFKCIKILEDIFPNGFEYFYKNKYNIYIYIMYNPLKSLGKSFRKSVMPDYKPGQKSRAKYEFLQKIIRTDEIFPSEFIGRYLTSRQIITELHYMDEYVRKRENAIINYSSTDYKNNGSDNIVVFSDKLISYIDEFMRSLKDLLDPSITYDGRDIGTPWKRSDGVSGVTYEYNFFSGFNFSSDNKYQISFDPAKLERHNISVEQVRDIWCYMAVLKNIFSDPSLWLDPNVVTNESLGITDERKKQITKNIKTLLDIIPPKNTPYGKPNNFDGTNSDGMIESRRYITEFLPNGSEPKPLTREERMKQQTHKFGGRTKQKRTKQKRTKRKRTKRKRRKINK